MTKRTATQTVDASSPAADPKPAAVLKRGGQSLYTEDFATHVLTSMAAGMSLNEICRAPGTPAASTVRLWNLMDVHGFSARYARAVELRAWSLADEIDELVAMEPRYITNNLTGERKIDPSFETWRKTQVDTKKWVLSKLLPKTYGDKIVIDHNVNIDPSKVSDDVLKRIVAETTPMIEGTATEVIEPVE